MAIKTSPPLRTPPALTRRTRFAEARRVAAEGELEENEVDQDEVADEDDEADQDEVDEVDDEDTELLRGLGSIAHAVHKVYREEEALADEVEALLDDTATEPNDKPNNEDSV